MIDLATEKRSVYIDRPNKFNNVFPASFAIRMPAHYIFDAIENGLYIYKPKKSKRPIRIKK